MSVHESADDARRDDPDPGVERDDVEPPRGGADGDALLRSSAVVAAGTALSRATGLARTMVLAYVLGTLVVADAYNLANTAPNVIYDLVLGGVLSATLVPVLVSRLDAGDDDGVRAVNTVLVVLLAALTVAAVAAAPLIIGLYTWTMDPAERARQEALAVPLLRLFLPQVLFYGLTALGTALLNARRRFASAAFAPVLNNVVVIAVLLAFRHAAGANPDPDAITGDDALLALLGLGTTAGIAAMAAVLWPGVRRAQVPAGWRFAPRDPAVRQILVLSSWMVGYVLTNQVGLVVLLALANGAGQPGAVSAWSYAYLFFQLPYGLFAVTVMTTFLPELASAHSAGDAERYRDRFLLGLRAILVVVLPSAVALGVLATPAVTLLFQRGAFDGASTTLTADALRAFAVGLPGFAAYLYAMRGFYARQDTRTPFAINLVQTVLTLALAVPLSARWDLTGVVAAFSAAYTVGAVGALGLLHRHAGGRVDTVAIGAVARSTVAAAGMAGASWSIAAAIDTSGTRGAFVELAGAGGAGLAVYVAILAGARSDDLALVRRRLGGRGDLG